MLGLNHRLRNTPVSSSTTKLHSAISPSMNDQWSVKTLRMLCLASFPMPSRSSAQFAAPSSLDFWSGMAARDPLLEEVELISRSPTFPEARPDRLVEAALRHQVPLRVHLD